MNIMAAVLAAVLSKAFTKSFQRERPVDEKTHEQRIGHRDAASFRRRKAPVRIPPRMRGGKKRAAQVCLITFQRRDHENPWVGSPKSLGV